MNEPTGPEPQNEPNPPLEQQPTASSFWEPTPEPPPPPPRPTFQPAPPPPAAPVFAAPPRRRFAWAEFLGGTLFGCGCLPILMVGIFGAFASALMGAGMGGAESAPSPSVALVDVTGVITSGGGSESPFADVSAGARRLTSDLERARKDPNVKAVVLWIDSPGGSAAGSDVVYREVMKVKASGKPVVTAMGDVAASGGYYIASATDRIFANGATVTGSIGVIFELPNFSDPRGWIAKSGYDIETVKSGKYKDLGNPFRPMTGDERAYVQQMVNTIYGQFLNAVSKGRNMPLDKLRPLADGRVFTGTDAKAKGLVDEIGTLDDAIAWAGEKTGLGSTPRVHRVRTSPWDILMAQTRLGLNADPMGRLMERRLRGPLLLEPRLSPWADELVYGPAMPLGER